MHRVFIAINLPENVKKRLAEFQSQWPELPVRWTKPENLHITLAFLGNLSDEEIAEVCKTTEEVASRNQSFSINLSKISYGPPKKPPRMVWVMGEILEELTKLKNDLERTLLENFTPHRNEVSGVGRPYSPHITLGRIQKWEFRSIDPEDRPQLETNLSFGFEVSSIEVMESFLKRGGPEYTVLESCPLKSF